MTAQAESRPCTDHQPSSKKAKISGSPAVETGSAAMTTGSTGCIGTHDGTFHCDEALACYLLQQTEPYKHSSIVRTRDPAVLNTLSAVLDVGGIYDPESNRYDHHQRGFKESFGFGFETRLSSAGLVYKHFGRGIISGLLSLPEEDSRVEKVFLRVYKGFMESIDAIDNGIGQYDEEIGEPRYQLNTHLSARVANLNPKWNEDNSPESQLRGFEAAVALTGKEFTESVKYYGNTWLPAREYVHEALENASKIHPSGEIMQLSQFCPWKEHLYELEEELGIPGKLKYCIFQDSKGSFRVQAVSVTAQSFESRKALPAAWRGLRDAELSSEAKIPGCVFVHVGGFIGGHATEEGARKMAIAALAMDY
mmetsp:Transcript_6783/g.25058  ORF Transcript_6783/g.25058 Transcript_6783/m.25058 type:complete len:365 (+) Transcript_6783:319-1413(+)